MAVYVMWEKETLTMPSAEILSVPSDVSVLPPIKSFPTWLLIGDNSWPHLVWGLLSNKPAPLCH